MPLQRPPSAVLIDLAGVLHNGPTPIPGAVAALTRLRESGLPLRFLTNTTRTPRNELVERLLDMGFSLAAEEVDSAAHATCLILNERNLRPHFLVHPGLDHEVGPSASAPDTVVIGDAGERFTFDALNEAFRLLMGGCHFIAMAGNRYYRAHGELQLDTGAFVAALEFATGRKAEVIGKPAAAFFHAALHELGTLPADAVFIGDDLHDDIGGAQAAGLQAILVRSGKFRPEDEHHPHIHPDLVVDDFSAAVEALLSPAQ